MKTLKEINEKIRKGEAVVVRADEMPEIYEEDPKRAAKEVDIVTTGTFGAMCSSGVWLNFGHSDPPIKMRRVWLNEVEAYTGVAAVDAYLGAAELSLDRAMDYGGGHVIEDLIRNKPIKVRARAYGTDCYPRKYLETTLRLSDLNQAVMYNPRNNYRRYVAATNSTERTVQTYMGMLLPKYRNVNWAGTGELSPLNNDPTYETIGMGTRIFLGGAQGYVVGPGTQHSPKNQFGTITVTGDLKEMSPDYIRGATIPGYGTSLFVGIGMAIPILNEKIAKSTAIRHKDIKTNILDYGVPQLNRPVIKEVSYEELLSDKIKITGKKTKTACLSSYKVAFEIIDLLGEWIDGKKFFLSSPQENLPRDTVFKPMKVRERVVHVSEVMTKKVITIHKDDKIEKVCNLMVKSGVDQIPIVEENKRLVGIVTAWDITKATASKKRRLSQVMTKNVISSKPTDTIDAVSQKLQKHSINSTPVVDYDGSVVGIITLSDINRIYSQMKKK
ncbi:MAG: homocysteine biosynthesis protein [Candidatus Altiarchaeota archaeon]